MKDLRIKKAKNQRKGAKGSCKKKKEEAAYLNIFA